MQTQQDASLARHGRVKLIMARGQHIGGYLLEWENSVLRSHGFRRCCVFWDRITRSSVCYDCLRRSRRNRRHTTWSGSRFYGNLFDLSIRNRCHRLSCLRFSVDSLSAPNKKLLHAAGICSSELWSSRNASYEENAHQTQTDQQNRVHLERLVLATLNRLVGWSDKRSTLPGHRFNRQQETWANRKCRMIDGTASRCLTKG